MIDEADQDDPLAQLPPASGYRRRTGRAFGGMLDLALAARQRALGLDREIDRAAEELPRRRIAVFGVYSESGGAAMARTVERLRRSRHDVAITIGALSDPDPRLELETALSQMSGGKFANLNRLVEKASPLAADWVLLVDDDIALPRRFCDRLVLVAERLALDLAQPALSRSSHGAWRVNRRHPALARQTQFVEIGPAVLVSRRAWRELTPFPEAGMGWGLCLVWGALAKRHGWHLGVVDAVPVRHSSRPPGAGYDRGPAREAAAELLARHDHITRAEAERVLTRHVGLP